MLKGDFLKKRENDNSSTWKREQIQLRTLKKSGGDLRAPPLKTQEIYETENLESVEKCINATLKLKNLLELI